MVHYGKKIVAAGFLVFLGLWIAAAIRGLTLPYPPPAPVPISIGRDSGYFSSPGNYANNLKQIGLLETPLPLVLDNPGVEKIRILEKKAVVATGTAAFDQDESQLRSEVAAYQGTIFNEKSEGIEPGRRLMIEIGVHPDKFDGLVARLRKIGTLSSITVEQKDRTSEFHKLHEQRSSLKKSLERIDKLREGKTLSLDDGLRIEQRISELDKQLQALSLQFGELLGKESFYHVQLTLAEYQPGSVHDRTYTIPERIFHAFLWAMVWWFAVAFAICVAVATGISIWILWPKKQSA